MTTPTEETPTPVTQENVLAFLESLATPKTFFDRFLSASRIVARNLRRKGVTGDMSWPRGCPIANALREEFPGHNWSVTSSRVRDDVTVSTPFEVEEFIENFDAGSYRYLRR